MFYHLVQRSVDRALTELVARSMDRGWRVAIRGTRADHLDWLDKKLWLGPDETFLPHGLAGGPHDALQPVLLTTGAADNAPQVLMAVDGAQITPQDVATHDRACVLFSDEDPNDMDQARQQWRSLTAAGCTAQYWSDDSGRWVMKAERPAS